MARVISCAFLFNKYGKMYVLTVLTVITQASELYRPFQRSLLTCLTTGFSLCRR